MTGMCYTEEKEENKMADIRDFNQEKKIKQKRNPLKQSNLRLLKQEDTGDYKEKIRKHRLSTIYRTLLILVICAAVVLLLYILYRNKKYTDYTVKTDVPQVFVSGTENLRLGMDILSYSNDGARCMDAEGNVLWNQTYEMQNPIISVCEDVVAIADYNGRTIYIQSAEKQLGTITTNLPIRNIEVASNGVVSAVLEDSKVTWIYVYDTTGKELLKFHITMEQTGYPIALSLSPNALLCAVSYFYMDTVEMKSRIAFYNFDEYGKNQTDNLVGGYDYSDTVVPYICFMSNSAAFAIGDDCLLFFAGGVKPELKNVYYFDSEILSVYHNEEHVGLVFENRTGDKTYRLEIYDKTGNLVRKQDFDLAYKDVVFYKDTYTIYNEEACLIGTMDGRIKYDGTFQKKVDLLIPTGEGYTYTLVTEDSLQSIQLK